MENDLIPRPKTSNKVVWWVLLFLAIIAVGTVVIYHERDKVANLFISEKEEAEQVAVPEEEYVETVQDILAMRDEMRLNKHIDSVFLTMPEVILIDILINHGTSMSIKDIVTIYESNKPTYNVVLSGAKSQIYKDSLDKLDTIPKPKTDLE